MKLTSLLVICSLMTVSASVRSQDARVSIMMKETAIGKILKQIEKFTDYKFVYNSSIFPLSTKVDISVNHETVANVLNQLLTPTGFSYKLLNGSFIVITQNQPVLGQHTVAGTITDENNQPLPGVTVKIKGQTPGVTSTDDKGYFSIQVPDNNTVLKITYMGYAEQEIAVGNNNVLSVKLHPQLGALNEVVVVGYGKQNKTTLTGSVSAVSGSELVKSPSANITQSLAGRLPGLIAVSSNGGRPGADDATLMIRGLSTTGDNSPLIVIDGIVRSNFAGNTTLTGLSSDASTVNPLSYLDPNDVESISILKDAASTAIYGARAANGVILVTTKRGTEGATSITYTGNAGIQNAVALIRPLDSYTTATLWNQAWKNDGYFTPTAGGSLGYSDDAMTAIKNGSNPNRYGNTDWYHAIYGNTAAQQSHNIAINGGNARTRYFVSGGYLDQNGFYNGTGLKRYNIRTNLDGEISNIFDFSINISARKEDKRNTSQDPSLNALLTSPLEPVQYTNGYYSYNPILGGNAVQLANGSGGYDNTTNNDFESSATLTYKVPFIPGFSVKGLFSYDNYSIGNKIFNIPYTSYILNDNDSYSIPVSVSSAKPNLTEMYNQYQSTTSEISLNYNRTFKNHHINALLLYTETRNEGQSISASRVNFPSAILDQLNFGSLTGLNNGGSSLQNARRGIVGRLGYNYKEKYLFEFDSRYDGSDLFPPGHRYGFFPAVSAGWRLSEEPFIKDHLSFINNLKIRGSWGQAGNDRAGAFQYLNAYTIPTSGGYSFGGATAVAGQSLIPGVIANPVFTWEKATTTNVGLDANFWGNLLGITADYFYKRTSNVLATNATAIPAIIGGTVPVGNYAIVDNKGFEIELTHQNTIGKVSYYLRPSITFNRSKVVSYPDAAGTPEALRLTGKPVSPDAITGYLTNGLYQSQANISSSPTPLYANTQPGDIKYVDYNHDGKVTPSDQVIISRGSTPGTMFGFSAGVSYHGFDVSMLFQGAADVKAYIPNSLTYSFSLTVPVAYPIQQNSWTPTNPGATFPRLSVVSGNSFLDNSDYWLRNGAYLRMKNFELGYTLPKNWLNKLSISNTRIFINGSNLFTLSHVKGIVDPESSLFNYPLIRMFNAGVSVKFN